MCVHVHGALQLAFAPDLYVCIVHGYNRHLRINVAA